MKHYDCQWYKRNPYGKQECNALTEMQCVKNGKCSFYETKEQFHARQVKFKERILSEMKKAGIRCDVIKNLDL